MKKIKDLTVEEYEEWFANNCCTKYNCFNCPFSKTICEPYKTNSCWIFNKNLYSNEFLNKKIELEVPDILDEKEKEYLNNAIKFFRDRVTKIAKLKTITGNAFYICIFVRPNVHMVLGDDTLRFPLFVKDTMYKNMQFDVEYTLEELGL